MTFAVRTITRSATGGDIVHRPQVLEVDEVVIGRGSDCDIRLADLAVSLRHARMRQTGKGQVTVEALGPEPFEAAGRFTSKADLNLADTPKLIFGSHIVALSGSPDNDDVLVDVSRKESAPEGASAANEDKIFSLTGGIFGKRNVAWALAIIGLLVLLIWPIVGAISHANRKIHADQQWSVGPLSHSHAFLGQNCQACHVKALVSVRDDTCLSCHRATNNLETARQIASNEASWGGPSKVTLIREHADHARLVRAAPLPHDFVGAVKTVFERTFNHTSDRCVSCHLEHLADAPAKGAPAGQPQNQPKAIPVLNNRYDCTDCHAKLHRHIGSTMVRDTPDWRHHPEFRPLITRTPIGMAPPGFDRISLIQQPTDYTGLIFSHSSHLSKTGGVARMAMGLRFAGGALSCADCHRPSKDGKGFEPVEMVRDCSSCHSLAYAPGKVFPHGRVDKVIAAAQSSYGGGAEDVGRRQPNIIARLTEMFTGHASSADARIRALFAPKGLCAECHTPVAPGGGTLDYRIKPVHQTSRFLPWGDFDHSIKQHKQDAAGQPNCESCHKAPDSRNASDVLLPRIAQCAACHGKTKDKVETAASADCAECHSFHVPGMATPKDQRTDRFVATVDWPSPKRTLAAADPGRRAF